MEVRDHGRPTGEDRDWKRTKSCMLIPGGFHTMTDTSRAAGPRSGKSTNASAGLATAPQPRGLVHRVYGKQIVHAGWNRYWTIVATGAPHVEITPLRYVDGPGAGRVWVTAELRRRRRFDMRSPGPLRDRRRNRRYGVKRGLAGTWGQAKPERDSRLKSRGCGAKTGGASCFFGRIRESRPCLGLRRSVRMPPTRYGRTGRNVTRDMNIDVFQPNTAQLSGDVCEHEFALNNENRRKTHYENGCLTHFSTPPFQVLSCH